MSVWHYGYKTIRLGNRTESSIVMNAMFRREALKLDVEIKRPCRRQGHQPLDIQLQDNRWKRRKGLRLIKI